MAAKREAPSLFGAAPAPVARDRASSPPADSRVPPEPDRPATVSQLCAMIDSTLRAGLAGKIRVVGEITGFGHRTHWYFGLKDSGAVINCVMFAASARAVRFTPENGQEVIATGRVEFFAKQGRTQFYVEKIEPVGAGALDLEFRRLCEQMRAAGWFDPARKRPLPTFPRRIAVITSRTSAAYQDVLNTIGRRCPAVGVTLIDVRVQGDESAKEIVRALRWISARHAELAVDAVLLTRGGGSKEDLWTFNDPSVAQAVLECAVPVVAAIGHETDTTIAELVADERCATPTQAAMRLTPDAAALSEQSESIAARLRSAITRHLRDLRRRADAAAHSPTLTLPTRLLDPRRRALIDLAQRSTRTLQAALHRRAIAVERASARLETHRPAALFARRAAAVERVAERLESVISASLRRYDLDDDARRLSLVMVNRHERYHTQLDTLDRAIDLVGPVGVMRRGYSMTITPSGEAIRSAQQTTPGMTITTIVADGSFTSTVAGTPAGDSPIREQDVIAATSRLQARPARSRRKPPPPQTDQMRLF